MASDAYVPAHDLRGDAVDYRRDRESRSKWSLGAYRGPGRSEADEKLTPARAGHSSWAANKPTSRERDKEHQRLQRANKKPLGQLDTDSSAEEDVSEVSAAPEPDADVLYSFDISHGPNHGSQILSTALSQAVQRFENKVTDKLVKDEYEVLDRADANDEAEAVAKRSNGSTRVEDDYEFI